MNANAQTFGRQALRVLSKQKAIAAIIAMLIIMLFPDSNFYSLANFSNVFRAATPNLIIAFGVTLVVICRGCDLSVGSVMAMAGILAITLLNAGLPIWLAILLAILSGSFVGFINGFLVVVQKTEAFIITLGMGMLVQGVALQLTDGNPVTPDAAHFDSFWAVSNGSVFGIPNITLIMVGLGIITFLLLRFTSFGRNCYALGGDYEVAEHSGINVVRTKWIAFVLSGTLSAISGVLLASRMTTGLAFVGVEVPLLVNCSVVIGGTSFAGGVGGVVASFVGVMVMQFLRNCMDMIMIDRYVQQMVLGIVIVAIISLDCYAIKRKKEAV